MYLIDLDGQEFFTSASIGISFSSLGYQCHEDILRDADTAMYRAKANGKARHEVFDLGMHTRAVESLKLENDLRQGIDSFVNRMITDKDSRNIVETIITLAKKLGKSTVAEGVETKDHQALLSEFACDYGQGYLFSKPLNSKDAKVFLENNTQSESLGYQSVETISLVDIETLPNQYPM